jgi:hypothetical protein
MSDKLKSNITFSSNISDSYQDVLEWKSLVKLTNKISMTKIQNQLYHRGAQPYYCHNRDETTWGFIKNEKGEIVQSCRCENKSCSHFDKCMNEKYAKNIIRNEKETYSYDGVLIQPKYRGLKEE